MKVYVLIKQEKVTSGTEPATTKEKLVGAFSSKRAAMLYRREYGLTNGVVIELDVDSPLRDLLRSRSESAVHAQDRFDSLRAQFADLGVAETE